MSFEVTYQNPKKFTVGVSENVFTATYSNPKKFTADIYPHVAIPPVFVSAEIGNVDNNLLTILYDINIDQFVAIDVADYSVTLSGGAVTIIGAYIPSDGVTNKTVILVLSRIVAMGETGTFSYAGTAIRSEADDEGIAATLTGETITNNVVGTAPVFVSAAVANATPTKVVLTYDQDLDTGSVPATTDFTVTDHTISSVAIVGSTVELTLSTAVIYFDILYVTYTKGANPIQGDVGELDADDLASTLITNNVAVTGNEVGWWLASDTSTITKDGSNYVSAWNDKLASGRNLLQANGTNQPLWVNPNYIKFDGIDNFLKATFTWNQPEFIVMVVRQVTWTSGKYFFDGSLLNRMNCSQYSSTPKIISYAGTLTAGLANSNLAVNTWGVVRVLYNGVGSSIQVNATAKTTGNVGSSNAGGFTLGANGNNLAAGDIEVAEVIGLSVAPSTDYETSLYNVVKRRAGL